VEKEDGRRMKYTMAVIKEIISRVIKEENIIPNFDTVRRSKKSGIFLYRAGIIIIIKDGKGHNPYGPAEIRFNPRSGCVLKLIYWIRDKQLKPGDFLYDVLSSKSMKEVKNEVLIK